MLCTRHRSWITLISSTLTCSKAVRFITFITSFGEGWRHSKIPQVPLAIASGDVRLDDQRSYVIDILKTKTE